MEKDDRNGILAGMVLGDANLTTQKNELNNPMIRINHSTKQRDYLVYKIALLQPLFHYNLLEGYSEATAKNHQNGKEYRVCRFYSRVSPKLKTLYHLSYPNGKYQNSRTLLDYLTPHGMAIWFMDDGSVNDKIVMLSTYCSEDDAKMMQAYFREKWNIEWRVGKHYDKFFLRRGIKSDDAKRFFGIIAPYIIPQMQYKMRYHSSPLSAKRDDIVRHSK